MYHFVVHKMRNDEFGIPYIFTEFEDGMIIVNSPFYKEIWGIYRDHNFAELKQHRFERDLDFIGTPIYYQSPSACIGMSGLRFLTEEE